MKKISIIGFGRFAKVLIRLLQDDFEITVFTRRLKKNHDKLFKNCRVTDNVGEAFASSVIIYAVPIGKFEQVIRSHEKFITKDHLIIDTLSVKLLPAKILNALCKRVGCRAILTHPMFGPDSSKDGFKDLPMVMNNLTATKREFSFWKNLLGFKGLKLVLMSPEEHDQRAANSQGLTHFVGRLLESMKFSPTNIDTQGAKKLQEVKEQTCNDTVELFRDLQQHNPHTTLMREKLIKASRKVSSELLPKQVRKGVLTIGVQGSRGSFNEVAAKEFVRKGQLKNAQIKFLFTTRKVLTELNRGQVDLGVFAIGNSKGGLVDESIAEIGKFEFQIIERVVLPVQHFLMKRLDVRVDKIRAIMAHDQVFKQCAHNLQKKHSKLKLVEGEGDLKDTARAAQALSEEKIPKHFAILGNIALAKIFGLEIFDRNLEDDPDNRTTFLVVRRL